MTQLILFNKPYGVLSQFSGEDKESTLYHYINLPNVYPAGRLDKNSEGLLLLTDNGRLQHRLSHPDFDKSKYYWVQVEGCPTERDLTPLRKGLRLNTIQFKPATVAIIPEPDLKPRTPPIRTRQTIPTSWLKIIIQEGKNHQIRRMTAAIGFPTLRLVRYQIDQWSLGNIEPGCFKLIMLKHLAF